MQDFFIMGRKKNKHTIEIAEGVYIKDGATGENWHYYFTVSGIQFRASTKTSDKTKATQVALNAYHDVLEYKQSGKVVERISFKKLVKKHLETLEGQNKLKFHQETIRRHLMPFFGKVEDIKKINDGMLNDYLIHRKSKTNHTVLNQSLNKENVVFNQMMRLAHDYEWVKKSIKFKRQSESQSQNRRSHFTSEEYAKLIKTSRERRDKLLSSVDSMKERGRLTNTFWQRNLLHDIILIMTNTGIRVDEITKVTWRDIDWKNESITLRSAGKTKSSRTLLVRKTGMHALKRIYDRRLSYLKKHKKSDLNEKEPIQSLENGVFVKSMKKGFNELLKECGFQYESVKEKHSMTSLRHTYATMRLTTERGKKATSRSLAKQMGTSERMIDKHYGHDVVENYKDELLSD